MARSLSWIDSERLAALLEVVSPSDEPAASRGPRSEHRDRAAEIEPERLSALFERQPEPHVRPPARTAPRPAPQSQQVAKAPAPRPAVATRSVPQSTSLPAAIPVPDFRPSPSADVAVRIEEFIDWVVDSTRIDAAFVTDANGLVVVERGTRQMNPALDPAMTCSIDLLLNHVSDVLQSEIDGYVALQRDGLHLVTLWTPTDYGRFYGVLISKAAPHPESLTLAGQGFRALFSN